MNINIVIFEMNGLVVGFNIKFIQLLVETTQSIIKMNCLISFENHVYSPITYLPDQLSKNISYYWRCSFTFLHFLAISPCLKYMSLLSTSAMTYLFFKELLFKLFRWIIEQRSHVICRRWHLDISNLHSPS